VDIPNVGSRVRALRKLRGVTQQHLAERTHYSVSLIKKIEQGIVPPSSAFVAAAAASLGVRPSHLYGTDERDAADEPRAEHASAGELRAALDAWDDPRPEGDPLSLAQLERRVFELGHRAYGARSVNGVAPLAYLLHHLFVAAEQPGHDGELARGVLWDAYRIAASLAGRLRQLDLAAIASERHIQLAPATGDPLRVAVSAFHRSTRHLQFGDFPAGLRALDRARGYLDTTPAGRSVQVQLHLRSAVLAARSGDVAGADGFITEAHAIVTEHRPPSAAYLNIDASALNIAVHWCAAPVENYDGAEAIRRADQVHIEDRARPERVAHHHIDMARAWLLHGDRERVLENLNVARRILPEETRRHPSVRETVLVLAEADRRSTKSLANFARWAGIAL
jgi:transcriptional regulator with XRE-family HTH domain